MRRLSLIVPGVLWGLGAVLLMGAGTNIARGMTGASPAYASPVSLSVKAIEATWSRAGRSRYWVHRLRQVLDKVVKGNSVANWRTRQANLNRIVAGRSHPGGGRVLSASQGRS